MTYSIGDMVERVMDFSSGIEIRRGIVIDMDAAHMKVYWFHSGVTELYLHRMMKDAIKVVTK